MKIANPNRPPKGGWRYTDPDTGVEIIGVDFQDLVHNVRRHRSVNKLMATQEIAEVIANHLCSNKIVPCIEERAPTKIRPQPKAAKKIMARGITRRGTGAILKTLRRMPKGTAFVEQAEADRRASICARCPMNLNKKRRTCCGGDPNLNMLKTVIKLATAVGLRMNTSSDRAIHVCSLCGCELKAKVWCSSEVLRETEDPASKALLPKDCWVREVMS